MSSKSRIELPLGKMVMILWILSAMPQTSAAFRTNVCPEKHSWHQVIAHRSKNFSRRSQLLRPVHVRGASAMASPVFLQYQAFFLCQALQCSFSSWGIFWLELFHVTRLFLPVEGSDESRFSIVRFLLFVSVDVFFSVIFHILVVFLIFCQCPLGCLLIFGFSFIVSHFLSL